MKSLLLAASLFLAGIFGAHHVANTLSTSPPIAAVLSDNQQAASSTLAIASTGLSSASIAYSPVPSFVSPTQGEMLSTSTQVSYVTQDELTAEINDLRSLIYQLAASTTTAFTDPQVAANGYGVYSGETAAPITQITASAITGLTASEIPDLSSSYLSVAGGTLSGLLSASNASTSELSVFNNAWFGATATSSFDSAGNLGLSGILTELSTATSSFTGALGIGTTTPIASLQVTGNVAIGSEYNYTAPGNSSSFPLDVVSNTTSALARFAEEDPTSTQYPFIVVDDYHNNLGGGPQISMRNWAGNINSPGGSLPSGTLLGEYLWEGPVTSNGTNWASLAGIEAFSDEASSPYNTGDHMGFYTNDLGGSVNGNNNVERMRIAPSGIGIRTTAPSYQLDVKGYALVSTTTFTGVGLNDGSSSGTYNGSDTSTATYTVVIDSTGTPDTFKWQKNGGAFTTGVAITGATQTLTDGVKIKFTSTTGHTIGDQWTFTATPSGPFGVQNAGGTREFVITNTGNVGIATSSPTAAVGFAIATTTYFATNVGVATTNPYARLSVRGPDAASSTLAFNVVNSASTTVFAVFDGGNAQLSGTLTQSSDQRLKTNIQSLEASSSLSLIDALNPVTFNWIDPNQGSTPQLGFIAQQVQQIFPNLVSTTSATALTPDGTLGLNYIGLISPIVSAIQDLSGEVQSLIAEVQGFAQSFTSQTVTASQELCVGSTCVTPAQFLAMVQAANQSPSPAQQSPAADSNPAESVTQNSASSSPQDTPPTITINGANPAIIQVGDNYADLGATVTDAGPGQADDANLGLETFLNGTPMDPIVIDTIEVATDTIQYVATDSAGLTATSTRTVLIESAIAATSTSQ